MLNNAVGSRLGLVLPAQKVPLSQSDLSSIVHVGVPQRVDTPWQSAAGGVGRKSKDALLAAIGEGIERAAAATVRLPSVAYNTIIAERHIDAEAFHLFSSEQRQREDFPFANIYSSDCPYVTARSFDDDSEIWVPQPLVTLQDDYKTGVPTSSGLAAGPTAELALLRALQELIERDALMVTWLHGLPGRRVKTAKKYIKELIPLGGEIYTFDLTPAYSAFAVVAVAGGIKKDGKWRYSLGVACRESWDAAEEKAYLEWNQGVLFAGIYNTYVDTSTLQDPEKIRSFDEHAMYYTQNPDEWYSLRLFNDVQTVHPRPRVMSYASTAEALRAIKKSLKKAHIEVYYRDITTIDALQVGLRVVRVLSPDMAVIFAHQEWPFIDRVDELLPSRYPHAIRQSVFPYKMPHPLG